MNPDDENAVEELDAYIDATVALSAATGIVPLVVLNALPSDVFDHYLYQFGTPEVTFEKCACGDCGNLVASFVVAIEEGEADGDDDAHVVIAFSRTATEQETISYLEDALAPEPDL